MGHNYIGHTCIGHNYECVRRCVRRARARAACRRASRRRYVTGARIGRLGGGLPAVGGLDRRRNSRQSGRRRTALRRCADLRTPSTRPTNFKGDIDASEASVFRACRARPSVLRRKMPVDAETGRTRAEVTAKLTEEAKLTDCLAPMHQRMPLDPTDREPTGHLGAQSPPGARRESSRRDRSDRIYDETAVRRGYTRSSSTIRDRYFGAAAHQGCADAETRPRFIVTSAVVGATWYTRP